MNNNTNMLYQNSVNELMQAKNYQSQISQKEFEIRLMDIDSEFSPNLELNYATRLQQQNEMNHLIYNRNQHLCNAIDTALDLAIRESQDGRAFYSMAYLAILSINSFIRMQNGIDFILPLNIAFKLSQTSLQLPNNLVKTEISTLKQLCKVII